MRVLIVALTDQLPTFLTVMNPELDVCAIVADNPEPAKAVATHFDRASVPIIPYWRLKECLETYYFDYVINLSRIGSTVTTITNDLRQYDVPSDKIVAFLHLAEPQHVDSFTKLMNICKQNINTIKIFSTGNLNRTCSLHLQL